METNILDQTLPPALQGVVGYEQVTADTKPIAQGEPMPELTAEQVKAIATETASSLLKQKDAELAVATKIESLTNEANSAKASLATATTKVTELTTQLAGKVTELATAGDTAKVAAARITELTADHAALTKQINGLTSEKAIASRKQALATLGLTADAVVNQYTAIDDKGALKIADADFNGALANFKVAIEVGKASATTAPVVPPVAGTPAPVVPPGVVPPVVVSQGTASVPAPPDLSNIDQYTAATAALLAGSMKPSVTGRATYAAAVGAAAN